MTAKKIIGIVTHVPRDSVVIQCSSQPINLNVAALNEGAVYYAYEPDPPFEGEAAYAVLAQGYPVIVIKYPVKQSLTIKSPAIHSVKLDGSGTRDVSDLD
jgi:hypothetical protein